MDLIRTWDESVIELERHFQEHVAQGVKSLLESKHLYQTRLWPIKLRVVDHGSRGREPPGEIVWTLPRE
jgi:hypothetical protein